MNFRMWMAALCGGLAMPLWAADSEEAQRERALDARCEQARAAKLRPVQEKKIEECMRAPPPDRAEPKTREECERYWSDYGWGSMTASGTRNPSLYENIPECRAAFKARQAEE